MPFQGAPPMPMPRTPPTRHIERPGKALAAHRFLSPLHSDEVMDETAAAVAHPGIDDPHLVDLTRLPFVTIDEVPWQ